MTNPVDTGIPEETKNKIIGILSVLFPECKIYLYGSRARGNFSHGSDADIAINGGQRLDRLAINEARELMLALITPLQIEVADYYALPEEYRVMVDKDKILWKK
jgi:predicted nucleotidyltransferase